MDFPGFGLGLAGAGEGVAGGVAYVDGGLAVGGSAGAPLAGAACDG